MRLIPAAVRHWAGRRRDRMLAQWFRRRALERLAKPGRSRPHPLKAGLIISLTSYPARFRTLHLTLACLLDQTVTPDRVILWIADDDIERLPESVRQLEARGLEIRACDDLRSYKKLIPALEAFPDAFIATADDDIYYPRSWLETLVAGFEKGVIPCHRAHRIVRSTDGSCRPYRQWRHDVQDERARTASTDLLATSGAGALYFPGSLAPLVTDREKFQRLSPDGDDLWFHWCARVAGTRLKKVGKRLVLVPWDATQSSSLWDRNENGGNDRAIAQLEQELGRLC